MHASYSLCKVKYLGVKFGEVTPQQASAPAIQKVMLRALAMQHWDITLMERLALLDLWILPVLSLLARVVFLDKAVIASLQSVYHTALRRTHYRISLALVEGWTGGKDKVVLSSGKPIPGKGLWPL